MGFSGLTAVAIAFEEFIKKRIPDLESYKIKNQFNRMLDIVETENELLKRKFMEKGKHLSGHARQRLKEELNRIYEEYEREEKLNCKHRLRRNIK